MITPAYDETPVEATNLETEAFNRIWQNDELPYRITLQVAKAWIGTLPDGRYLDGVIGDHVVRYWQGQIAELVTAPIEDPGSARAWAAKPDRDLYLMLREVGSWHRIDRAAVGAVIRELIDGGA